MCTIGRCVQPPTFEIIKRWREDSRRHLFQKWKEKLAESRYSHWTINAIRSNLEKWVNRKHGAVTFHLTQILTGHGCFGRYLCKVAGRELTPECHHCGYPEDTAEHTLMYCPSWREPRSQLIEVAGENLSLPALIMAMVDKQEVWNAVIIYCEDVMTWKEAAERGREDDPSAPETRRKRVRHRRLVHSERIAEDSRLTSGTQTDEIAEGNGARDAPQSNSQS